MAFQNVQRHHICRGREKPLKVIRQMLIIVVDALESCMGSDVKMSKLGQRISGKVNVRGLPNTWFKMEQYLEVIGDSMALTHKPGKNGSKIQVCVKVVCLEEISDKVLKSVAITSQSLQRCLPLWSSKTGNASRARQYSTSSTQWRWTFQTFISVLRISSTPASSRDFAISTWMRPSQHLPS